jgi:hypothetical protein
LVGLFDATGGVVEVNGLSLPGDVASIQQCIGVMPQHDILWEELSPVEHMRVFAAIKGVPAEEVAWLRKNIVLEPSEGGGFGTDKGSEEMLQQGSKDYSTVPDEPPPGEGRYVVGGTSIKDVGGDTKGMVDAVTDKHSGGKMGFINIQQQGSKSLEDAYRDAAKQMGGLSSQTSTGPWNPMLGKTTGLMPSLRDLNVNPDEMIARYGHSAADEISKRLASPDTLTIPGAIGGAAGTAAAQAGRKPRRA